jgi:hypothetical protein
MAERSKSQRDFFQSAVAAEVRAKLLEMSSDDRFQTSPSYSANTAAYPDNLIPFVDKHMNYLGAHPGVNPTQYIANLKLVTRLNTKLA